MPTTVLDQLLQVTELLQKDLDRYFAGTPLTASRTHLLWQLRLTGPSTQQVLASAMGVSPRNVTGLVDALEASGYVSRCPHPDDRRAVMVTLTELGECTMRDMEHEHATLSESIVADLTARDRERLEQSLGVVIQRLRTIVEESDGAAS